MGTASIGTSQSRGGTGTRKSRLSGPVLLLLPLALYLIVFLIWPMARIAIMSFYKADPMQLWVEVMNIGNYQKLVADPFHANVLLRTFRVAVITTLVCMVLAYPMAYFLARTKSRFRGIFTLMVFMPLLVSVVIRSYGWIVLLGEEGVINGFWKALPIATGSLPLMFKEYSVVLGLVQVELPYMIIPLLSAMQNIDPALEDAATGLGAGPFRIFFRVLLPLSTPGLISGTLLVFTSSMSAFSIPMFIGGPSQTSMAVLVYQQMLFTFNWPLGSAVAMAMVLTTMIAIVLSLVLASRAVPKGLRV